MGRKEGVRASSVGEQTLAVCGFYFFFLRSHQISVTSSEITADGNKQTHKVEACFSRRLLFI